MFSLLVWEIVIALSGFYCSGFYCIYKFKTIIKTESTERNILQNFSIPVWRRIMNSNYFYHLLSERKQLGFVNNFCFLAYLPCVSRIVAFIIKKTFIPNFFCMFSWLSQFFNQTNKKSIKAQTSKYELEVHKNQCKCVCPYLLTCLGGPQSLAQFVELMVCLVQGWATLLASRATLETSQVSTGQYMSM